MSNNQRFGYLFGAVYILVGLVGFLVTPHVSFAATEGKNLLLFGVNPLHNLIHIAVGGLFVAGAAAGAAWSWKVNTLIGGVYLAVGAIGLFAIGSSLNILALNQPDNALHIATAILGLAIGASGRKEMVMSGRPTPSAA
ncbi:MAG TPA: DUF4383 domain-containing protein [Actinomycetota bacterium]|jgi:hypothetical protein